jgi:hypothetical protein
MPEIMFGFGNDSGHNNRTVRSTHLELHNPSTYLMLVIESQARQTERDVKLLVRSNSPANYCETAREGI